MTREFFPEISTIPYQGGYLGTYRLFAGQSFRQIPGRVVYPESWQATKAAEAYVKAGLNPKIESELVAQESELSEFDLWKRQKAEQEAAEKARVFGSNGPRVVRNCGGGEVKVELQRKRVRA